jgi:hypothetical protein
MNKRLYLLLASYLIIIAVALILMIKSYALTISIVVIASILCLIESVIIAKGYKHKYLFLGEKFKNELEKYKKNNIGDISDFQLRIIKNEYRKTGFINYRFIDSPYLYFGSLINTYLKENSHYDLIILKELFDVSGTGNELYQLFENINEKFNYKTYYNAVKQSEIIYPEIKDILLNPSLENAYSNINRERTISRDELNSVNEFEEKYSFLSDEYIKLIKNNAYSIIIDLYKDYKLYKNLQQNVVCIFYSKENDTRISVIKNDLYYTAIIEKFEFDEDDSIESISKPGYYNLFKNYGIYDLFESVIKDLNSEYDLTNYKKIEINI